jgi:hypothetical protein
MAFILTTIFSGLCSVCNSVDKLLLKEGATGSSNILRAGRLEDLSAVLIKITVFWDMTPCRMVHI